MGLTEHNMKISTTARRQCIKYRMLIMHNYPKQIYKSGN